MAPGHRSMRDAEPREGERSQEISPGDEEPHSGMVDEWIFTAWIPDGTLGIISAHRLTGSRAWYWAAVVEKDHPLLHLAEWDVQVRAADPFIVKAPEMWAEHHCDSPLQQWSIGNEAYFVALDQPDDAFDRAYGNPTPLATDLEWYATAAPEPISAGYSQVGVAHGTIELLHRPNLEFVEIPAQRWRRWGPALGPLEIEDAQSIDAPMLRAPFAFPDDTISDWSLTPGGWRKTS